MPTCVVCFSFHIALLLLPEKSWDHKPTDGIVNSPGLGFRVKSPTRTLKPIDGGERAKTQQPDLFLGSSNVLVPFPTCRPSRW